MHRIKRDVSHNNTSPNVTKEQNVTTTGVPTVATTLRRRPVFGWLTRRRNYSRPTGRPSMNLTGLTDAQKEKIFMGNRSAVPLDHLGFPIIPNNPRGTRRPRLRAQSNASKPTQNSGGNNGNGDVFHDIMAEFRMRENTQASNLPSSKNTSTDSVELSSKGPYTKKAQKNTHQTNRRDMSLVISLSIWIAVVASFLLSAFICLTVHWVRQRRRGKLVIAPSVNKRQRSAAIVFTA